MTDDIGGWELNRMARELADELIEAEKLALEQLPYDAFDESIDDMVNKLLYNLKNALTVVDEYGDYKAWKTHIETVFEKNAYKMISLQGNNIYIEPQYVIGGQTEFIEGVAAAREALGLSGRMDEDEAAQFWKTFIYMPAREGKSPFDNKEDKGKTNRKGKKKGKSEKKSKRDYIALGTMMYERTVNARLSVWGTTLAPEWWWLEHGNTQHTRAYPNYSGTGFVKRAQSSCRDIFKKAFEKVEQKYVSKINSAVLDFINNPERYQPGTILDYIEVQGYEFKLHVTPTREFGVRRTSY